MAITVVFAIGLKMHLISIPSQIHMTGVATEGHSATINSASSLNPVAFNADVALDATYRHFSPSSPCCW